jgi:hypothetical protein
MATIAATRRSFLIAAIAAVAALIPFARKRKTVTCVRIYSHDGRVFKGEFLADHDPLDKTIGRFRAKNDLGWIAKGKKVDIPICKGDIIEFLEERV